MLKSKQFKKKPVIIDAIQYTGSNEKACLEFCPTAIDPKTNHPGLIIPTKEGNMECSIKDFIIKGVKGEFYPCKPDIFALTYDEVEGDIEL